MNEQRFCQSCAMPLTDEVLGTEKFGEKSQDYCSYCYKDGAFAQECTMEEMIGFCAPMTAEAMHISAEEATAQMKGYFPQLKRWQK